MATGVLVPQVTEVLTRLAQACPEADFPRTLHARGELTDAEALAMATERLLDEAYTPGFRGTETLASLRQQVEDLEWELESARDDSERIRAARDEARRDRDAALKKLAAAENDLVNLRIEAGTPA